VSFLADRVDLRIAAARRARATSSLNSMKTTLAIYDALLQANIPNAAARGVAEALEKDMEAVLATKADLQLLTSQMERRFEQIEHRFAQLQQRFDQKFAELEQRFSQQFGQLEPRFSRIDDRFGELEVHIGQRLESLELRMTVKLGSLMIAGFTVLAAVLKFL
jgi:predicted  nucleic acid-binding Zn-ribbon protein